MKLVRRDFLKSLTGFFIIGEMPQDWAKNAISAKPLMRIAIGSDSHYGQPKTEYKELMDTFIKKVNLFSKSHKCDLSVINGDIIHDNPSFLSEVKGKLDNLDMPYYVGKGNHDKVNDFEWEKIWGMPANIAFSKRNIGIIIANTSDEKGNYLSPDLIWLEAQLKQFIKLRTVLLFLHIPQGKWTPNAIETPKFFQLLKQYNNIKAVFHGHEHDKDNIINYEGIPYIFDSHIGGSWGTDYKGFRVIEIYKNDSLITYLMNPDVEILRSEI